MPVYGPDANRRASWRPTSGRGWTGCAACTIRESTASLRTRWGSARPYRYVICESECNLHSILSVCALFKCKPTVVLVDLHRNKQLQYLSKTSRGSYLDPKIITFRQTIWIHSILWPSPFNNLFLTDAGAGLPGPGLGSFLVLTPAPLPPLISQPI